VCERELELERERKCERVSEIVSVCEREKV